MKNLVRIMMMAGFVTMSFASVALAQESSACPSQFSVEERNMILEEAALVMNNKAAPSLCFEKLINETLLRRQAAGVKNIDLKDVIAQLAASAWKAEVSEK